MNRPTLRSGWGVAPLVLLAACTNTGLPELERAEANFACPCVAGYECDKLTNSCLPAGAANAGGVATVIPGGGGPALVVRAPVAPADNPFADASGKLIAVTAEVPGLPDGTYRSVMPYQPGMVIKPWCTSGSNCPHVPNVAGVQVRVELLLTASSMTIAWARGRSVPFNPAGGDAVLFPYVTNTKSFAPVEDNAGVKAIVAGKAGFASATQPGAAGNVFIIGGAEPLPGKVDAYDPQTYGNFSNAIAQYSPNLRQVTKVSDLGAEYRLQVPRAFATAAAGKTVTVVVGGYTQGANGAQLTKSIEYIDSANQVRTSTAAKPDLEFARAGATVVHLFDDDDYFLVLGGRGDSDCKVEKYCASNTWELWHRLHGNLAKGQLNEARWNHAAVKLPGKAGGYVMLIGGENATGVLNSFEVLQFSKQGYVSSKGQACNPSAVALGTCNAPAFLWEPLTQALPVARTLPGAVFARVPRHNAIPDFSYVYMVGGFADVAHAKPLARLDVFDINKGEFLSPKGYPLLEARGAPMVAIVPHGPTEGQILVAGGSQSGSVHLKTAELVSTFVLDKSASPPTASTTVTAVENAMLGGPRTQGAAVALNTGHVLLVGGVGPAAGGGLEVRNEVMLWNPF